MQQKAKICFVCSDNIGRSVTAEYCLRDYLEKQGIADLEVSSAGTNASSDITGFSFVHFDELREYGIDAGGHTRTQLTRAVVDEMDIIVAMAVIHQEWLHKEFGIDVSLFNEIVYGERTSVTFSQPNFPPERGYPPFDQTHYIYAATPIFARKMRELLNISGAEPIY